MKRVDLRKFQVRPGRKPSLEDIDPAHAFGLTKEQSLPMVEKNIARIATLQFRLYAEHRRALLIVLQGMDTSGKDGVIRHVMSGLNPQGTVVASFKGPTQEELDHDFLWRVHQRVPRKGDVGIFNRSHYEDVLIGRVRKLAPKKEIKARYKEINGFEKTLSKNGVVIVKLFLCISKNEQKKRLEERLADPEKNWKFSLNDVKERALWNEYVAAYEEMLGRCSTGRAPWFIIPSDKKWVRNLVASQIVADALERMDPKIPPPLPGIEKIRIK